MIIGVSAAQTEVHAVQTEVSVGKHPAMVAVDAAMIAVVAVTVDVVGRHRGMTADVVVAMDAEEVPTAGMAGEDNS